MIVTGRGKVGVSVDIPTIATLLDACSHALSAYPLDSLPQIREAFSTGTALPQNSADNGGAAPVACYGDLALEARGAVTIKSKGVGAREGRGGRFRVSGGCRCQSLCVDDKDSM